MCILQYIVYHVKTNVNTRHITAIDVDRETYFN